MSNKMLCKRLLATGMSMAMAATLFATNSITIFAEEGGGDPIAIAIEPSGEPAVEEVGGDPASWAPVDLPTPEFNHEEGEPETVWQSEDGKYRVDVVEVTNTMDVYMSDVNSQDEDGEQTDDYQMVNKEDTEGQTLDYTDAVTIVTMGDASVYLEDENGDRVQVKNENGEDVDLELPVGTTEKNLHEVQVVEKEDGSLHVLNGLDTFCNPVVYGYFDEEGKFIEGKEGDEGVQAYYKDKFDNYKAADTMYYTTKADGTRIYLTEEMYNAITTGESDVYDVKKEYEYKGQKYSQDDLKQEDKIKEVKDWSYTVAGDPEKIGEKNEPITTTVGPWWNRSEEEVDTVVSYYKVKITGEPTVTQELGLDWRWHNVYTYPTVSYFEYKGATYVNETSFRSFDGKIPVGTEAGSNDWDLINSKFDKIHKVTPATDDKVENTVYIRVYDNENPDEPILELDEVAYNNLRARNVSLVGDKYAVRDKDGDRVLIDKEDYTFVTEQEVVTNIATVNYYTVQDKYEPTLVDVNIGDQTYQLSVDFWQNDRIGVTSVELKDNEDGTVDVTVNFAYSQYRNGFWSDGPEVGTDSITRTVSANTFGYDGTARMTVKYTPAYNRTNVPRKPEEIDEREVQRPVEYVTRNVLRSARLAEASDVVFLLAATLDNEIEEIPYTTGYEPADLINWLPLRSEVNIGDPEVSITKNEQPAPPQRDDIEYIPRDPDADSPVVVPLSTAPGQVLGAQREEPATDGAAVLGASRARGTADETTAPFVRVLVMAAVASAALFLTRKREEEN